MAAVTTRLAGVRVAVVGPAACASIPTALAANAAVFLLNRYGRSGA